MFEAQLPGYLESLDFEYEKQGLSALYRASDLLWKHHESIEGFVYQQHVELFEIEQAITLYDLTNTSFEGSGKYNELRPPVDADDEKNRSLDLRPAPTIFLDAGIASEANIQWLRDQGYKYIIVSRKRHMEFDDQRCVAVEERDNDTVRAMRVEREKGLRKDRSTATEIQPRLTLLPDHHGDRPGRENGHRRPLRADRTQGRRPQRPPRGLLSAQ
ncbi:MAG: hypothetical protein LJE91_08835 [Gammaproteobacteria bacterium]|nr:hypothetical protein [Gammaproteobacteria bacterium]